MYPPMDDVVDGGGAVPSATLPLRHPNDDHGDPMSDHVRLLERSIGVVTDVQRDEQGWLAGDLGAYLGIGDARLPAPYLRPQLRYMNRVDPTQPQRLRQIKGHVFIEQDANAHPRASSPTARLPLAGSPIRRPRG